MGGVYFFLKRRGNSHDDAMEHSVCWATTNDLRECVPPPRGAVCSSGRLGAVADGWHRRCRLTGRHRTLRGVIASGGRGAVSERGSDVDDGRSERGGSTATRDGAV